MQDQPSILEHVAHSEPFFSICIPQHNRTGLLIDALQELKAQTFQSFQVCISEDCSTDARQEELIAYLKSSGMAFRYSVAATNLRYDANLRQSIGLAQGRFCILFGNDDCLATPQTLDTIANLLNEDEKIGALIGNFEDWKTGEISRRIRHEAVYSGTSTTAVRHFRNLAFVSGLVIRRAPAQEVASPEVDGSEMYQMHVFCRVIASGWKLRETTESLVRKDVASRDDQVDSYTKAGRISPCPIQVRHSRISRIASVVANAVRPFQPPAQTRYETELILRRLYCFTYPYWITEHRRIQSWNFALGTALGVQPNFVTKDLDLGWLRVTRIWLLWVLTSVAALMIPLALFRGARRFLYWLSRSLFR
jgi:glycosyltransferase involved in cell wall biosynthesis